MRQIIEQRVPLNLNIIEEQPLEGDFDKIYDQDGVNTSMINGQGNFKFTIWSACALSKECRASIGCILCVFTLFWNRSFILHSPSNP